MRTHYYARTLVDSEINNNRITTFEITFPRFIAEQLLTHRMHSRNAGSLRAVPTVKILTSATVNPLQFAANQPGMSSGAKLTGWRARVAQAGWELARGGCIMGAKLMHRAGVHKEICNRVLAPFLWQTYIITSNEFGWNNFFLQRCSPHAQPEIAKIANLIRECYTSSVPLPQLHHIPFDPVFESDFTDKNYAFCATHGLTILEARKRISIARIARVSYFNHGCDYVNYINDLKLYDRLVTSGHYSPLDHVLTYNELFKNGIYPSWKSVREELFPQFIQER